MTCTLHENIHTFMTSRWFIRSL